MATFECYSFDGNDLFLLNEEDGSKLEHLASADDTEDLEADLNAWGILTGVHALYPLLF
jgi:hypothetical protein